MRAWASRTALIDWLTERVLDEQSDRAARLELAELLGRLKQAAPDDERTVSAWDKIRRAAPKAWERAASIRETIIMGEAVRRGLDLLLS